jgi:membrane fusion protein (multidrug efflux system)
MSERNDGNGAAAVAGNAPQEQREAVPPEYRQPAPNEVPDDVDRPPQRRPLYKRPLVLIITALVLAAGVTVGVIWWLHARQWESTDDAFIDADVTQVSPRVSGHVASVLGDDNRQVQQGQKLVELDPADLQARYAEAHAAVAAAQSGLQQAKDNATAMQAQVGQAEAAQHAAETEATRAKEELQRFQALSAQAVTRQQLANLRAAAESAEAQLQAARQKTIAAQAQVKFAQAQIITAEAQVTQARASEHAAFLQSSYVGITAPITGYITNRSVQVGDYVQPGQALMALVPQQIYITANYKETQLTEMKPGQEVDITVDAYPGHVFHGRVDSIQRGTGARFSLLPPENATGNYVKVVQLVPVKIIFNAEPDYPLGVGMSVVPKVKVR